MQFRPQPDSAANPASFMVLYGGFKLEITSRITKFVKVTNDRFAIDNAQIPAGEHRLALQVRDEMKRMAKWELRVAVE